MVRRGEDRRGRRDDCLEIRTDLAVELTEALNEGQGLLKGIQVRTEDRFGAQATVVEITSRRGEKALGRPKGVYVTIGLEAVLRRERDSFSAAVEAISGYLGELLGLPEHLPVLVAGLGNRAITPDSVGPLTADHILVTRHMVEKMPDTFGAYRPVTALIPGVLGTTGMESSETVRAMVEKSGAAAVIAIDAIAARDTRRLCSTVQLCNTGISPGSGIGNHRNALNESTLGVPVIGVGVPTVTDAGTLALDILEQAGVTHQEDERFTTGMIVTCSDIDRRVREVARVLAYGVNSALQKGISVAELDDLTF